MFICRITNLGNLHIILSDKMLYAPNFSNHQAGYKKICNPRIQEGRREITIKIPPGGTLHDYVPFYFGYRPPMLLPLKNGRVEGYSEGQEPLIYLVSNTKLIEEAGLQFVFTDGHAGVFNTNFFNNLSDLIQVDLRATKARTWSLAEDPDFKRRKQAEFLIYQKCPWSCIEEVVVFNEKSLSRVMQIFSQFDDNLIKPAQIISQWYY